MAATDWLRKIMICNVRIAEILRN